MESCFESENVGVWAANPAIEPAGLSFAARRERSCAGGSAPEPLGALNEAATRGKDPNDR